MWAKNRSLHSSKRHFFFTKVELVDKKSTKIDDVIRLSSNQIFSSDKDNKYYIGVNFRIS